MNNNHFTNQTFHKISQEITSSNNGLGQSTNVLQLDSKIDKNLFNSHFNTNQNHSIKHQNSFEMIKQMEFNYSQYQKTLKDLYFSNIQIMKQPPQSFVNSCESAKMYLQCNTNKKQLYITITPQQRMNEVSSILKPSSASVKKLSNQKLKLLQISSGKPISDDSWRSDRSTYKERDIYNFSFDNIQNLDNILNSQTNGFPNKRTTEIEQIQRQFEQNQTKAVLLQQNTILKLQLQQNKKKNQRIMKQMSIIQQKAIQQSFLIVKLQQQLLNFKKSNTILNLQKQISQKDQIIQILEKKINNLQQSIINKDLYFQRIQNQMKFNILTLNNQKKNINKQLLQKQQQLNHIKKTLEQKIQEIQDISQLNLNYQEQIKINQIAKQSLILQKNSIQDQLINTKSDLQKIIQQLNQSTNLQDQFHRLNSQIQQYQKSTKFLKTKINNYQNLISEYDIQSKISKTTNGNTQQAKNLQLQFSKSQIGYQQRWSESITPSKQNWIKTEGNQQSFENSNQKILMKNKSQQFFTKVDSQTNTTPLKNCLKNLKNVNQQSNDKYFEYKNEKSEKLSFKKIVQLEQEFEIRRKQAFDSLLTPPESTEKNQSLQNQNDKSQNNEETSMLDKVIKQLQHLSKVNDILNLRIQLITEENNRLKAFIKSQETEV